MSTETQQEAPKSKFDLEHSYEFVNHGESFKRPEMKDVIGTGEAFRAFARELPLVEAEPERFEHVRTLPFPPLDAVAPAAPITGMARQEPPARQSTAEKLMKAAKEKEQAKQKARKGKAKAAKAD